MNLLLYATESYAYLKDRMLSTGRFQDGRTEQRRFPDGERYLRVQTPPTGYHAVVVGGTISDADTMELYDLASGLTDLGARALTLVIPYFGCGTMERAVHRGEVVTAKARARLLSSLPRTDYGNHVLLLDLHSEGIPHYFEGNTRAYHVYGKELIIGMARQWGRQDFVLACTDAGRAKWVESLANDLDVPAAFVFKRRRGDSDTEVAYVNADVRGRHVIIYDDMIRTGGSLLHAGEAYREAGARRIDVLTTHGLFVGDAYQRLRDSGLFTKIGATDSHPRAVGIKAENYQVCGVAELLTRELLRQSE
ncbi:MAG: ribose-phosphate diphosphokinase [Catalinimonas sp.]